MTNANPVASGLTSAEAQRRLTEFGENRISSQRRAGALALFIAQFKSPIIILMHVGVRSTADALPAIIANLQGRGFHLVTISTLLESAPKSQ
jgi:magnesium-transporting ATPase (P-type)